MRKTEAQLRAEIEAKKKEIRQLDKELRKLTHEPPSKVVMVVLLKKESDGDTYVAMIESEEHYAGIADALAEKAPDIIYMAEDYLEMMLMDEILKGE